MYYTSVETSVDGHRTECSGGEGGGFLEIKFRRRYQKLYHSVEDQTIMILQDQLVGPPRISVLHIPSHAVTSALVVKQYLLNTPARGVVGLRVDLLAQLVASKATMLLMSGRPWPDCYPVKLHMVANVDLMTHHVVDHIENTGTRRRTRGASENAVMKLKKEEEYEGDGESCVVCLDELSKAVTRMPCSHLFHSSCLLRWLEKRDTCPICRRQLEDD